MRMFHQLSKKEIIKFIYPILLLVIVLALAVANIKEGTWLTGWDNLHQEFNFELNLERHLFSSWQEYQGLGLPASMAHAADLPRMLIIFIFDIFIPTNYVRYAYMFFCLYLGALGTYFLFNWIIRQNREKINLSINQIRLSSFLVSLFFIFNLGTLLIFYNPISMFPTQWAYLPWLILIFLKIIKRGGIRNYFLFALFTLFATPMAYTPTLFVMYALVLSIFSIGLIINKLKEKILILTIKRITLIAIITILINLFWLVPFVLNLSLGGDEVIKNSAINDIVSEDIFERNAARGRLQDVAILKGFTFDNSDFVAATGTFEPMLGEWILHFDSNNFELIGYVFFIFLLIGIVVANIKGLKYSKQFAALLIFSFFFLFSTNPPLGFIFEWLRNTSPMFEEAMRFPYTKIIQIATLIYSISFGFFIVECFHLLNKLPIKLIQIFSLIIVLLIFMFAFPMYKGNLIYNELKVEIPKYYFEMFDWFEEQPKNVRIANLPQDNFMNWDHYLWGQRGSGFLWYGIQQPILDRSFDVWSKSNEKYFDEVNSAIYNRDIESIEEIAKKYNIGWFLYDKNVRTSTTFQLDDPQLKLYDELLQELEKKDDFELVKSFGNDDIIVLGYLPNIDKDSFIKSSEAGFENVDFGIDYLDEDYYYFSTSKNVDPGTINIPDYFDFEQYALAALSQDINTKMLTVNYLLPEVLIDGNKVFPNSQTITEFQYKLDKEVLLVDFNGDIVSLKQGEEEYLYVDIKLPIEITYTDGLSQELLLNKNVQGDNIEISNNQELEVRYPYLQENLSLSPSNRLESFDGKSCIEDGMLKDEKSINSFKLENGGITLDSLNSVTCDSIIDGGELPSGTNYILSLEYQKVKGQSAEINVIASKYLSPILRLRLKEGQNLSLIDNWKTNSNGFNIFLWNISRGTKESQSIVNEPKIQFYPGHFINKIKLNSIQHASDLIINHSSRVLPFLYSVDMSGSGTLELAQTSNQYWQVLDTASVTKINGNDWGNQWKVDDLNNEEIFIIYQPALFEFISQLITFLVIYTLFIGYIIKTYFLRSPDQKIKLNEKSLNHNPSL